MGLTGGEFVAEYLISEDIPYVFGIPGHGDMAAFDAFKDRADKITMIAPKHEQAAAHMADAYYRASGKPLATMTSIGPGSLNIATGLATAFIDSIPVVSFTGGPQTYMLGKGVLQELERQQDNVFPHIMQPMVKRNWDVQHVDLLADVLPRAFNTALSGRPGPVHIELPMDVQANITDMPLPDPAERRATSQVVRPDSDAVDKAAAKLLSAKRPVILAGGGCLEAEASAELRAVAEYLDAAVVVTMMGKGVFPEDHPLAAEHTGSNGTAVGNHMTRNADVILAVGTRFAEQTSSSYLDGMSFSIPPTEIVHFDIDATEIGKNYPTAVGVVCDSKAGLSDLLDALQDHAGPQGVSRPAYREEISTCRQQWHEALVGRWTDNLSLSRVLHTMREELPREAIAIASAGHPQIQAFQE
ncbi:MAG: thiamine pyrophosphate-binding protein, partial [Solirubrobacterales bacterium]